MLRALAVLVGGIFVGAVGVEILRKKYPDGMGQLYTKVGEMTSGMKEAFKEGYKGATRPRKAAKADV